MNPAQAARIRGLLSARFPDVPVNVMPDPDGARIFMEHQDGFHVRVTTGDRPGPVLRALLGQALRLVDDDAGADDRALPGVGLRHDRDEHQDRARGPG